MWIKLLLIFAIAVAASGDQHIAQKRQTNAENKSGFSCVLPTPKPNMELIILAPKKLMEKARFIRVHVKCDDKYNLIGDEVWTCKGGQWEGKSECKLKDCGMHLGNQGLLIGGKAVKRGEFPWNVMIYSKISKSHICGGSLISEKVVISAAHCFPDRRETIYEVAAGKIHRDWDNPDDRATQQNSAVEKLIIPPQYSDNTYFMDVAILKLVNQFKYTNFVATICLDFNDELVASQLKPGVNGHVAGWGINNADEELHPDELQHTELPYIDPEVCDATQNNDPTSSFYVLTCDKICAGFENGDTTVCRGDSGAGLAYQGSDKRFYLQGVVSNAPKTQRKGCNAEKWATFTRLAQHKAFLERNIK